MNCALQRSLRERRKKGKGEPHGSPFTGCAPDWEEREIGALNCFPYFAEAFFAAEVTSSVAFFMAAVASSVTSLPAAISSSTVSI